MCVFRFVCVKLETVKLATKNGVDPATLLIEFGPSDTIIGARYTNDAERDDAVLMMKDYPTVLHWIKQFPDWYDDTQFVPHFTRPFVRSIQLVGGVLTRACVYVCCIQVNCVPIPPRDAESARRGGHARRRNCRGRQR